MSIEVGEEVYQTDEGAIVMLAGPIKHWWDENWDTPEHWEYVDWRNQLNDALVAGGFLVYRPHEAFKGKWTERAQAVNDLVLRMSDVILDMTPPGIPSLGTDGEKQYAKSHGNALIIPAPPAEDFTAGAQAVVDKLEELEVKKAVVDQEIVIESVGLRHDRGWMVKAAAEKFLGQVVRLHFETGQNSIDVVDASEVIVPDAEDILHVCTTESDKMTIPMPSMQKMEVLARAA